VPTQRLRSFSSTFRANTDHSTRFVIEISPKNCYSLKERHMWATGLIGLGRRSAVAVLSVGGHLGVSEGFGVPVVECQLLGRRSRMRRTSGCQYHRGWRQLGRPGPRRAKRLARARGSVYRPRHGTPCPPLLPPRRPLAKRETETRIVSFTWSSVLPLEGIAFLSFICARPSARYRTRDCYLSQRNSTRTSGTSCNNGWKMVR